MRIRQSIVLVLVLAVPAVAQAFRSPKPLCFTSGSATYQLGAARSPDYKIRIDNAAASPDLRIRMIDDPDTADLVLVDDIDTPANACKSPKLTTIRVAGEDAAPDVTVSLGPDTAAPDYRIYVHSARFSPQDAAALLAVMWKSGKTRLAAR